jgi:GH18 family chitinase
MEGNGNAFINIVLIGYGASNILCSTHIGVLKAASPATQFRMPLQFVNAVSYPTWKIYKGHAPSELQVQLITHIFYAFARYTPVLV